jgi:hypothetical protein
MFFFCEFLNSNGVKLKNICPIEVIQNYSNIRISSFSVNDFGLYFTNIILEMHLKLYIAITGSPSGITCTSVFVFGCIINNYFYYLLTLKIPFIFHQF